MESETGGEFRRARAGFLANLHRSFRISSSRPNFRSSIRKPPELPLTGEFVNRVRTTGLDTIFVANDSPSNALRPLSHEIAAPRIDSYRFSMANLEDSQDVDLDAILGELCALESKYEEESRALANSTPTNATKVPPQTQAESRPPSHISSVSKTHVRNCSDATSIPSLPLHRTDSPDNDSAFSDTVSMLSSESSASSGASAGNKNRLQLNLQNTKDVASQIKAEKIRLALEKMKEASIKKLFIKAFSTDGSSKSLLVDEKMTCGYVARLLADKNHVAMEPKWAIVEHLTDLHMERVYEDHEFLVENLMLWTRESKNKILFMERPDKISLFQRPEKFLICDGSNAEMDEHTRSIVIDEFFNQSINMQSPLSHSNPVPPLEGPLYLKSDSKKGWKKYHFAIRSSGLYYYPKEKTKTVKELVCLTSFDVNEIYIGINWKKKFKAPTDYCFAIKHPKLQQPKSLKFIKFLCAEDKESLEKWIVAMRIAKYGRQLLENYRSLVDDLTQEDLDHLAEARSCSVASIALNSGNITPQQSLSSPDIISKNQPIYSTGSIASSDISSGRHSCASSSSSSGCMSDGPSESEGNAFDSEFPMGTIKRKPSMMKPNIPLTSMTRQLKEMVDLATSSSQHSINSDHSSSGSLNSSGYTNSGTLTRRHSRRKSNQTTISEDSSSSGTLKKHYKGSAESMSSSRASSSGCTTPTICTPMSDTAKYEAIKESPGKIDMNGYYKSPKGEILPNTGIILGYITNQNVIPTDNIQYSTLSPHNNDKDEKGYYFSTSTEDLHNMPLPSPPQSSLDSSIGTANSTLNSMFSSTFSLDSLPPPPPPLADDPTIEGYDLSGSQLSLMSLPPPPSNEDLAVNNQTKETEKSRVSVSEIINQLSTNSTQQPAVKDSNVGINKIYGSIVRGQPIATSSPDKLMNHNNLQSNNTNSQIYASCVAEMQGKTQSTNNQISSPIILRKVQTVENKPTFSKAVSFTEDKPDSPVVLRRQNSSVDPNVILTVPCSPNKKNKKITFVLPDDGASPPSLPNKPPPPKRCESTRLSSPKRLSDSSSNPPMDFIKDLQRVMKKKWQVAQKCKLEPSTTPHEVLGFREYPDLTENSKEANVSNWIQEHYGYSVLYENVRNHDEGVVEYASTSLISTSSGSFSQRNSEVRKSLSKKRPPPPPPKRSETTQLSTQKLR